jgi:hypothetical protein
MTERKITYALSKIKSCKEKGCALEALIRTYHLNLELLKYIVASGLPGYSFEDKKIKTVINEFLMEQENNTALKTIINKRSIKSLKPWLNKMDAVFKSIKLEYPKNTLALQNESEKIFGILKISVNKLFVK